MRESRRELECVFCLGGGELRERRWSGRLWYDDPPDYARADCEAAASAAGLDPLDLRTALECRLFGADKPPRGWVQVAAYASSGEAQCWDCEGTGRRVRWGRLLDGARRVRKCRLCDGGGFVYVGDGWFEVVYGRRAVVQGEFALEVTDTFGGEANYCWVRRARVPATLTRRGVVRALKALAGLTGKRCSVEWCGDELTIRPLGPWVGVRRVACVIGFASFEYC